MTERKANQPSIWVGIFALFVAAVFIFDAIYPEHGPTTRLSTEYPTLLVVSLACLFLSGPRPWRIKLAIVTFFLLLLVAAYQLPHPYKGFIGFVGFAYWYVYRFVWLPKELTQSDIFAFWTGWAAVTAITVGAYIVI